MFKKNKNAANRSLSSNDPSKLLNTNSVFAVKEAYNSIRTNLLFTQQGEKCPIFVITSPTANNGKTINSANLAISFAQMGKRTLIIDADMRNPSLHKLFSLSSRNGLSEILADIKSGKLDIDMSAEDIHTFVEGELTARLGQTGKRLHTARSRNDQVALDIRLTLRKEIDEISEKIKALVSVLCNKAEENKETIMPGYTHLQRAQPITFGHHLMAYAQMLLRDLDRLADVKKRMNVLPLGSGALAGTTYPLDRNMVADLLGFDSVSLNSLDGVSDRDFCIELASALSLVMVHLSRFSEEIIMWCSWEFKFVELDDAFSTGSSIMPQKKNPDIAELVRGKSGRVFGDLTTLLTVMKGIALAYNKDMQEDKEAIFDAVDTVKMCLNAFTPMIDTMTVLKDNMRHAAAKGFINATDCADYLVGKGLPFRDAYKATGELVALCIDKNLTLETLPLVPEKN